VAASYAGVENVIKFYQANKDEIGKNKVIEKFIKLKSKSKLKAYVEEKMI